MIILKIYYVLLIIVPIVCQRSKPRWPGRRTKPEGLASLKEEKEAKRLEEKHRHNNKEIYSKLPGHYILSLQNESCTGLPYIRNVTADGCIPSTVKTQICVGGCNSAIVSTKNGNLSLFRGCFPDKIREVKIKLKCPGRRKGYKRKREFVIESCKCAYGKAKIKS
ncbi:gremlin-2-like [Hydractinia symbiolongicarpus]|uniref:gremlin-2-like n=1 Tax=Hydractinia symbiolongicarpus TaxID=13093 RepID=UPI0025504BDE|nr:gremlin-2-like [Hydractinia symbiolongicarpus]